MVTDWPARFRAAAACSWVAFLRLTPFTCPKRGAVSYLKGKRERESPPPIAVIKRMYNLSLSLFGLVFHKFNPVPSN